MRLLSWKGIVSAVCLLTLAGCATQSGESIYVPATQHDPLPRQDAEERDGAPETPVEPSVPEAPQPQTPSVPGYRTQGESMAPAARSLVQRADQALKQGQIQQGIAQLERAQRISPRSAVVYMKLAEAYVRAGDLGRAEQFTLKGLSQAGDDKSMQRSGWRLLSDIRRARGDIEGAEQARARGDQL